MCEGECELCEVVITQPICTACLEEEMEVWINENNPELLEELRKVADEFGVQRAKSRCILCNGPMDICSYCFTDHILDWLMTYPLLIKEFMTFFNFDLHYNGYGKKLLELV